MSTRPIVHLPHPSLRIVATEITEYSSEVASLANSLMQTLQATRKPRGVGLAAPQINESWRIFATLIDGESRTFINPRIARHSKILTLGDDGTDPHLEGCLSIPTLYGPVPRFKWVELEFKEIKEEQLVEKVERFEDFPARVIQHENDHLNGTLFLDYSLQYELPVYDNVEYMTEVPQDIIATMVANSWEQTSQRK